MKNMISDVKKNRKRLWRLIVKNRYMYLMLLPVIAYFIIFKYWPMYYLRMAFYDFKIMLGFEKSKYLGFQNFVQFMTGSNFTRVISNTMILNILSLFLMFPLCILLAIMLNEVRSRWFKNTIQTLTYMPHFISTVILISMINNVISPSVGILGSLAKLMGGKPYYYLGDPAYFRAINVISGIWQTTGWNSIVFLAAITSIDPALYEAATVDGAGRLQRICHVTLPGIRDTILILIILRIGALLGSNFEKVYLLQNDLNLSVSETLATYVYKTGMTRSKLGFSTAVGLFESVVSLFLVLIANIASRKLTGDNTATVL